MREATYCSVRRAGSAGLSAEALLQELIAVAHRHPEDAPAQRFCTAQPWLYDLAAPCARAVGLFPLSDNGGSRECRMRAAPAISCAMCTEKCAHEHTGSAEAFRPSLRDGFTVYLVLSSVNGLSCHRRPQEAL